MESASFLTEVRLEAHADTAEGDPGEGAARSRPTMGCNAYVVTPFDRFGHGQLHRHGLMFAVIDEMKFSPHVLERILAFGAAWIVKGLEPVLEATPVVYGPVTQAAGLG